MDVGYDVVCKVRLVKLENRSIYKMSLLVHSLSASAKQLATYLLNYDSLCKGYGTEYLNVCSVFLYEKHVCSLTVSESIGAMPECYEGVLSLVTKYYTADVRLMTSSVKGQYETSWFDNLEGYIVVVAHHQVLCRLCTMKGGCVMD